MSLDLEEILISKGTTRSRMTSRPKGLLSNYDDIWLLDGVRTAFADLQTVLRLVSPIDLGIKVAREVFRRSGVSPADVHTVTAGNMALGATRLRHRY
jgi:hypothetical protein